MNDDDIFAILNDSTFDVIAYQYLKHYKNYRTIIFNQTVDSSIVESVILPLQEFERDESNEPVKLILSTPGGSVSDSLVLCNIIDNYKKPLEIVVLGYACSMGTIILCSGNKNPNVTKYCYPFTYALFHAGYSGAFGESLSVRDQVDFNTMIDRKIKDYVISNTNITEEEYASNERRQWYLTATDLKEKGLIDVIIGEEKE